MNSLNELVMQKASLLSENESLQRWVNTMRSIQALRGQTESLFANGSLDDLQMTSIESQLRNISLVCRRAFLSETSSTIFVNSIGEASAGSYPSPSPTIREPITPNWQASTNDLPAFLRRQAE